MHYRNGRPAKNGDTIVQIGNAGFITHVGVLENAQPGNDYCNGEIRIANGNNATTTACLCDCLRVDDVAAILKEKNLAERPADHQKEIKRFGRELSEKERAGLRPPV